MNENAVKIDDYEFGVELEERLEKELEESLADLELLKEDRDKIGNPDAMGKVILDEVWKQFANQIGLDITNETLIQKYERENPEPYEVVGQRVMNDERYRDANKEMQQKQAEGILIDEYTGKEIKPGDKANLDHTIPRKALYDNDRRKQANIPTEDLANKKENLNPTNESLNKSKGAKDVDEMIATRSEREKDLREQNKRANEKIDKLNISEEEKRQRKEKNNKRLQDKLDADDELMRQKAKEAREAINQDIAKGVVVETGKKAGKDALQTIAIQALFELLKQVMNALVRFFKSGEKTFKGFLEEMKMAVKRFFTKIKTFLRSGAMTGVGTIVSEIFGPVVSLFKKLASVIKQGFRSLGDAIAYLKSKESRNKPVSVKFAEVGKIIVAGLTATGAIFGGEIIEKVLVTACPIFAAIKLPLLGSLANIFSLFFAALISGVIGAIVLNLIDKEIAKRMRLENEHAQIEKGNEVLNKQEGLLDAKASKVECSKKKTLASIQNINGEARAKLMPIADKMEKSLSETEKHKGEIERLLQSLQEENELI